MDRAATHNRPDERVLILAPRGRNAELVNGVLTRATVATHVCADAAELCREMLEPTGAVVMCEEALDRAKLESLAGTLGRQPPWSEIPLLVLTGSGRTTRGSFEIAKSLGPRGNVTLMERPVRILTMLSAVRAALRARRRQYEVRDLLARERAARAQAEAASNAKDHFLATLSHELRTPLNPVLMTVSAMAQDPRLPPEFREDVEVVKRNIELESKLIDDLLDLTRIARGKLELRQEAVDMHALINHAIHTCGDSEIQQKRLSLDVQNLATSRYVWGDSARLAQVVWNLLKNAVKFTAEGGAVIVRSENAGDGSFVLSVIDSGIGIEPEAAARIFDAFEQESRGITRRYGGLGLGLAICKALVELHGGAISVHSEGRGRGSTFQVRLATIPEPKARASSPPSQDGQDRSGLRILLVEDHEATARVMARLLRSLNHDVKVAQDVRTAKDLARAHPFDVVVSDLGLPDGNGIDLLRHLRETRCIPAVAVTGYGMEDDIRRSKAAGFNDHLVKPVDLPKLQAAIRRAIHAHANQ